VCGWDAGGQFYPEPFSGQPLYFGVVATCPYTQCVDARPAAGLQIVATANGATGSLTSDPAGLSLVGAGTVAASFVDLKIELTAVPQGAHARAVLIGACSKSGGYGKAVSCYVRLAGDMKEELTYECEPGFSCAL
jgi:hypothetical protein